ncbi:flagellar protein FlgN [Halomonas campisalis]|uniref:Flagellar protein FlgN n=1 Tax=Billgrantia campisalis TaxID=74661 RepID=A0ABS9P3A2_9GAMM|nr:flagellar protein FlgN [Halomonas campisalis]MCG6656270.1 flagellar protein FlgN [Halomonas campisalis]MDR5861457.1 flagellar protein FlgN [Halomonas campisalis]
MSLSQLLTEQQQRLDALIALLERERALLTCAKIDGEALKEVAERKGERLEQLEATETLRQSVQRRLGYAEGLEGANQAARDAGCQQEWAQTLERTREAHRLNTLNGQLLSLRMSQNKRLLDFIHDAAEKTVYRASGRVAAQPGRLNTSV